MTSPRDTLREAAQETKEQPYRRYYEAFRAWFMQSNCDFWNECNAPEHLAQIAVDLQGTTISAAHEEAATQAHKEAAALREEAARPKQD